MMLIQAIQQFCRLRNNSTDAITIRPGKTGIEGSALNRDGLGYPLISTTLPIYVVFRHA